MILIALSANDSGQYQIMAKWIGYFGLGLLALLWGTMVPTVAHLLERWDPYFLAAFRYIGALPVMWAALALLERRQLVATTGTAGDWRMPCC